MKIDIKPLSVNQCWQGKRFKTPKYKSYELELMYRLPDIKLPAPPFEIYFKFGFSSKLSDWDNPIKPLQDILQKRYEFDDRDIFKAIVEKEIVPGGKDYIEFKIKQLDKQIMNPFETLILVIVSITFTGLVIRYLIFKSWES